MTVLQSCLHQLGWIENSQLYPKYLHVDRVHKRMITHMETVTPFSLCLQSPRSVGMQPVTRSYTNGIFEESVEEQEFYFEGGHHCTEHPTIHPIQVSLIFK